GRESREKYLERRDGGVSCGQNTSRALGERGRVLAQAALAVPREREHARLHGVGRIEVEDDRLRVAGVDREPRDDGGAQTRADERLHGGARLGLENRARLDAARAKVRVDALPRRGVRDERKLADRREGDPDAAPR